MIFCSADICLHSLYTEPNKKKKNTQFIVHHIHTYTTNQGPLLNHRVPQVRRVREWLSVKSGDQHFPKIDWWRCLVCMMAKTERRSNWNKTKQTDKQGWTKQKTNKEGGGWGRREKEMDKQTNKQKRYRTGCYIVARAIHKNLHLFFRFCIWKKRRKRERATGRPFIVVLS